MSAASSKKTTPPPDPQRERAEQRIAMLRRLAEIGMDVAEHLNRLAQAGNVPEGVDAEMKLARIAKMVRMTLALEAKFDGAIETHARQTRLIRSWRAALADRDLWSEPSGETPRIVERLLESEAEPDDIAALLNELREAAGSQRREPESPGLSPAMVNEIKCRVLGIRAERLREIGIAEPEEPNPPRPASGRDPP